MSEKSLAGKIAIVTGASRRQGIGAAVCRALANAGADVFFTYWQAYDAQMPWGADPSGPRVLQEELGKLGVYATGYEVDLSRAEAAGQVFDAVEEWLGSASILVNNAAYSGLPDPQSIFLTLDAKTLDRHYLVNVRATTLLSVEFARRFPFKEGGRIINLTSGQSLGPMPGEIAYATTKGAVDALTTSLAPALMEQGITINAVNPGPTDTGWMSPTLKQGLTGSFPGGRIGTPEDASRLITFLADEDARWITGQIIHSEGGFLRG